ncbi:MAG: 2-oxo acid dehydrogenase subunit E2, partial [Solirubrobacteraceae bacterium]
MAMNATEDMNAAKGQTRVQELTRTQRAIAHRSAEARATVPDLELSTEVDMAACAMLRREARCSVTAMLVRACALALRECPRANGAYRDERFELYSRINVGVAIATEEAYTVATVFDADSESLAELTELIDGLARRARAGELTAPEGSGAEFTLSHPGTYGAGSSSTIPSHPQVAT